MAEQVENGGGNTQFSGWAIVEMFGHQREAGFVTTRYFGTACLFQVDVPDLPERDFCLTEAAYVDGKWTPAGAKVRRPGTPGRSRLLGPGAVYAMNPCTEVAARAAIEASLGRELVLLEFPPGKRQLPEGPELGVDYCPECGLSIDECECQPRVPGD